MALAAGLASPYVLEELSEDHIGSLKALHEGLFPVAYGDDFFRQSVQQDDNNFAFGVFDGQILAAAILARVVHPDQIDQEVSS